MKNPLQLLILYYHKLNTSLCRNPQWQKFRTELKEIAKVNMVKTIWFNYRMFPFHIARKLPFYFYGKVRFDCLDGKIEIPTPIYRRMVTIGKTTDWFGHRYICSISIYGGGKWILKGRFNGSEGITIDVHGKFTTGRNVALGTSGKIRCFQEITLGDGVDITEECQVLDSNYHFLQNIHTGEIKRMTDRIILGDFS